MAHLSSYQLVKTYSGSNFFNEFTYFDNTDYLTHGDVRYVDHDAGITSRLTYVNDAGNIVLKVDDSTFVPYGEKRDSVRVTSKDSFGLGTVWVLDAYHVPYGCSVWGAYWSLGADVGWPYGGEIDIFEGVNMQDKNRMALHTGPGCTLSSGLSQTGMAATTNCYAYADQNSGCGVIDANTNSYGKPFADAGGGVWVTEFAAEGINIWFKTRAEVPEGGIGGETIDLSGLGTPSATFPALNCDTGTFFSRQQIVFDITLCGDWAAPTMGGACPVPDGQSCYSAYVVGDGQDYIDAYFEFASLKVYATSPDLVVTARCASMYHSNPGDTCATIEAAYGLLPGQLYAVNQYLNCADIWAGTDICIPNPSFPASSSSSSSFSSSFSSSSTSSSTSTSPSSASTTSTSTSSSAAPSVTACVSTYTSAAGDTCAQLDARYNLVSGAIKQANQFLDCSNIWTYTPICIPDGPYNAPACKSTYTSVAGDTCSSIETKYNLVEGTIKTANTFLTCTDIWAYTSICIPDGPYKAATPVVCKTTYISMAGDTCATIDNEFNLIDGTTKSANSFLTCSDIWAHTAICVPDGPYKTNHEPGCATQTYKSLAGETCSSIEAKFALTAGSVSSTNTWVNCADIWTGTDLSICIPTFSNSDPQTCTKTIISAAGDTCTSIAQNYGTSAAWIKAWNPFLNCGDIWAYTPICVSHS